MPLQVSVAAAREATSFGCFCAAVLSFQKMALLDHVSGSAGRPIFATTVPRQQLNVRTNQQLADVAYMRELRAQADDALRDMEVITGVKLR